MKKVALIFSLLLLSSMASADIEARLDDTCGEAEPVISISDPYKEYSHAGGPNYYTNDNSKNLCVSGISESSVQEESCQLSEGFHLTDDEDNGHFSMFGAYRLNVCTGEMDTRITSELGSCNSQETVLFSVSGDDNAHVAAPSVFDRLVCGSYIEPENVTLSVEYNLTSNDDVYFEGESFEGEEEFTSAEYPSLVSEGDEMVAGIVRPTMKSASRDIDEYNILRMKTNPNASSYFVPFTEGSLTDVEDEREEILDRDFLSQVSPSFGNLDTEASPQVRVVYAPGFEISSNISANPGTHEFTITKTGENSLRID